VRALVKGVCLHLAALAHSFGTAMPYQPGTSAQRIRIGLTGLAFAFILVLLGSVVTRSSREETVNSAQQAAAANDTSEPLAELGVAPGADTTNNAAASKK
jgi:Na+(H+)/acetate symporter ActP